MALLTKIGSFTRPAAGTTNSVITGVGFTPTVVLFLASQALTAGTWRIAAQSAIGWAAKTVGEGTDILAKSASQSSNNATAPSSRLTIQGALTLRDGSGVVQAEGATITFQADGFTINWTDSPYDAEQELIAYLALGGDAVATTGDSSLTGVQLIPSIPIPVLHNVGFRPAAAIVLAASGGETTSQSIGTVAGGNQWALSLADKQGVSPSNNYRRLANDRAVHLIDPDDGSASLGMTVGGLSPEGLSLTVQERSLFWSLLDTQTGPGVGYSGPTSTFLTPAQIAIDKVRNRVYIVDKGNNRLVAKDLDNNFVGAVGSLAEMNGVCVDPNGNVYVGIRVAGDCYIKKYNSSLALLRTSAGVNLDGPYRHLATDGAMLHAVAVASDEDYQIYSTRCSDLGGGSKWGTLGSANGQMNTPWGIAYHAGEIFVVDTGNSRVQVFNTSRVYLRKWTVSASARGCAIDDSGNVLVAEPSLGKVRRYTKTGVFIDEISQASSEGVATSSGDVIWASNYTGNNVVKWDQVTYPVSLSVLYLGGLTANSGVSTKPVGVAPAAHNISTGIKSKVALLTSHQDTALNATADHIRMGVGVTDGTVHRSVAIQVQDNVATSNSDTLLVTDRALVKANNITPAIDASAVATFVTDTMTLTWNPNDAVATVVAWLAIGQAGPQLGAMVASQSAVFAEKLGTPVPLSADIDSVSNFRILLGDAGNMGVATIASVSDMIARLDLSIGFTTDIASESDIEVAGIRFNRPLSMAIESESLIEIGKLGRNVPLEGSVVASSGLDVLGLSLDQQNTLFTAIKSVSDINAYFKLALPVVRDPLPEELSGTVNWMPNPSAENSLIAWDPVGSASIEQVSDEAWDGTWSVQVDTDGFTAGEGVRLESVFGLELTGKVRTIWGQARLLGPANGLKMFTRLIYQDGTVVDGEAKTGISLGVNWDLHYAPAVLTDPAKVLVRVETYVVTETVQATGWNVDGAQIEEDRGQGPTYWVTGDYGQQTGIWTGVPHLSMSIRQPLPLVVKGTGRGGKIEIEAKLYRATYDNVFVEDISDAVIEGKVSMDPDRESTWTFDCRMTWDGYQRLDPNYDWLAPYLIVRYPDGTVKQGQLGLYFLVPSETEWNEYNATITVSAFDPLWLLARQAFTSKVKADPGVRRRHIVKAVLDGAVLTGGDGGPVARRYSIEDTDRVFKKGYEWARDENRLLVCNNVLEGMNFYPMASTAQGMMFSRHQGNKEKRLRDLTPVRAWAANNPPEVTVSPWIPRLSSLKSEVVGRIKTTPKALDMTDEILIVNDDPDLPHIRVRGKLKGRDKDKDHKNDKDNKGRRKDQREERLDEEREARDDRDRKQRQRQRERERTKKQRQRHQDNVRARKMKERRKAKRIYIPFVDDEATALEVAAALTDQLSARTEHVSLSVLPDPSVDYVRQTVILAIWDAFQRPVAVGQYVVRRITWGFTPSSCIQQMDLSYVDAGESELEIA